MLLYYKGSITFNGHYQKFLFFSLVQFPFGVVIITGFIISVLTSPNVDISHHLGPHANVNWRETSFSECQFRNYWRKTVFSNGSYPVLIVLYICTSVRCFSLRYKPLILVCSTG